MGFFSIHTIQYASQELGSKRGVLLRDLLVLTSLRVFNVLNPCSRSSQDTYARSPTTPIYTLYLAYKDSSSLSNVFISNTHSYVYVAFSITTLFSILYLGSCLLHNISLP